MVAATIGTIGTIGGMAFLFVLVEQEMKKNEEREDGR